ncbi:MAG: DUF485 domain-containing protein [Lentisphaerae bacterium]|nr:DUF485 domain-containing protein [Lentisphaerota bacterium]
MLYAGDMSSAHATAKNARIGMILFLIYLAFYAGFVYLSAFDAAFMASHAFAGINVAVVYGFGLIAAAFVLALVYLTLCHPVDEPARGGPTP